uniref:Uncharacterized protein n=1 Tax=Ixodes ricinus TaxID=34613 RepID=A0A6B0U7P7_IXORI
MWGSEQTASLLLLSSSTEPNICSLFLEMVSSIQQNSEIFQPWCAFSIVRYVAVARRAIKFAECPARHVPPVPVSLLPCLAKALQSTAVTAPVDTALT